MHLWVMAYILTPRRPKSTKTRLPFALCGMHSGKHLKCNRSVSSGNVLFHRLIRTKTSEEQGLSLFPYKTSFIMCPCTRLAWRWQCKCIRYHQFSTLSISPGTASQTILLW
ncbi:hypothetical protein PHMEG_00041610 [Phytophthora megakarya]|uniref:Uncharacterized protein n=1 Tax=Phytophthora megakarya TaxID=4795 RepID=A0A225UCH0_9STRA|nr:hypothetical protein PHMEG_00041610 [Phytophthora megakarya]